MDSQRATILIGGVIALLFLPETNLLPFDSGYLWYIVVIAIYTPFYISYTKLNVVSHGELDITQDQRAEYQSYARRRTRLNFAGNILLWGGLLLFLAGMTIATIKTSEAVSVFGLIAMITGLGILAFTRCPFCKKITVRNPFDSGGRCINCHRDIDINE